MAVDSNALLSLTQLKDAAGFGGNGQDTRLEIAINKASAIVRNYLGWGVVGQSAITEYHSPRGNTCELRTMDAPIVTITSVYEDAAREYGASTLLVADTDYIVSKATGKLTRIATRLPFPWMGGFRTVKIVGSYGYLSQDTIPLPVGASAVPADLVDVTQLIAARLFAADDRRQYDVSSTTDATGTTSRFTAARLTASEQERLGPYRRWDMQQTGERDT